MNKVAKRYSSAKDCGDVTKEARGKAREYHRAHRTAWKVYLRVSSMN